MAGSTYFCWTNNSGCTTQEIVADGLNGCKSENCEYIIACEYCCRNTIGRHHLLTNVHHKYLRYCWYEVSQSCCTELRNVSREVVRKSPFKSDGTEASLSSHLWSAVCIVHGELSVYGWPKWKILYCLSRQSQELCLLSYNLSNIRKLLACRSGQFPRGNFHSVILVCMRDPLKSERNNKGRESATD